MTNKHGGFALAEFTVVCFLPIGFFLFFFLVASTLTTPDFMIRREWLVTPAVFTDTIDFCTNNLILTCFFEFCYQRFPRRQPLLCFFADYFHSFLLSTFSLK